MSYPTKTKGLRSITVDGARYRWRFHSGRDDSKVTLQSSDSGGQQAIVTLRGFRDPWLAFSDGYAKFVPIPPKLVRRMIHQAIAAGWKPARRAAPVRFDFKSHENVV